VFERDCSFRGLVFNIPYSFRVIQLLELLDDIRASIPMKKAMILFHHFHLLQVYVVIDML
jgi:hypothetical protein